MVLPYINMHPPQVYTCSSTWIPLPPPSPYQPSGSSQCTSPEHPVSYIEPGLVICFIYYNIHVSMLFSQIIPPSPSPTESKRLFYTSVSLLLSTGKASDAGRDWGQEKKGTTEDEMAGWHHWLDGRESQWTPGVGDGQGGLACCDSGGRKELDMTEWLIWSDIGLSLPSF